jgi:hypothetical protein
MRLIEMMEEHRDTAGWGLLGTVTALFMYSDVLEQVATAALVAGAGWMGSYILKKLVTYLEGLITNWWKNRKMKSNNQ